MNCDFRKMTTTYGSNFRKEIPVNLRYGSYEITYHLNISNFYDPICLRPPKENRCKRWSLQ